MSDKHELSHQLVRRQLDVVKDEARQGSEQEREREREKRERETKVKNAAIKPKSKTETETDAVTIEKPRDATKCQ